VSMNIHHANNQRVTHPAHVFTSDSEGKGSPLRGGLSQLWREIYLDMVKKFCILRAVDITGLIWILGI
jgi:alpha-ketoglutarate-dependent taurine dioxygenase